MPSHVACSPATVAHGTSFQVRASHRRWLVAVDREKIALVTEAIPSARAERADDLEAAADDPERLDVWRELDAAPGSSPLGSASPSPSNSQPRSTCTPRGLDATAEPSERPGASSLKAIEQRLGGSACWRPSVSVEI